MVKKVDAPALAIKGVITPAVVRDHMTQETNCPAQYLERFTRSPEYQRWLQLERERQEQERMRARAREGQELGRGLARTR
ncbi:hypothetical protein [Nocardia sp. GAS34]|uniref:hypothetical protein n=1 Tax=unclassified Nocardia TaxID=2637762 RepID=UPI003D20E989